MERKLTRATVVGYSDAGEGFVIVDVPSRGPHPYRVWVDLATGRARHSSTDRCRVYDRRHVCRHLFEAVAAAEAFGFPITVNTEAMQRLGFKR